MINAILYKMCKKYGVKKWAVKAHVTLCMPMLRAFVDMWALVLMTGCHCDEVSMTLWPILLQHNPFSPCWWILMALHKMGGVKGMLFHGTNIDLIDICCQQRLAYFSWVYLESTVWLDSIMSSLTSIMFYFSCYPWFSWYFCAILL